MISKYVWNLKAYLLLSSAVFAEAFVITSFIYTKAGYDAKQRL